jgi:hypothetical protein
MAAACEEALREVRQAMNSRPAGKRLEALERASDLLRLELVRWVRRGEALDMIVKRIPAPSE